MRSESLRRFDALHPAQKTVATQKAIREAVQADVAKYLAAGGHVDQVPTGVSGRLPMTPNEKAKQFRESTGFLGADFVSTKANSARGGKC